jgi:hypothetical protein
VIKCAPFLFKIGEDLEIFEIHFKTHLSTFSLTNMVLNLTIMNFGNVFLTKVLHLNSPLGTKVSIFGNPIRHISNLYQFYYMVPRVFIPV